MVLIDGYIPGYSYIPSLYTWLYTPAFSRVIVIYLVVQIDGLGPND